MDETFENVIRQYARDQQIHGPTDPTVIFTDDHKHDADDMSRKQKYLLDLMKRSTLGHKPTLASTASAANAVRSTLPARVITAMEPDDLAGSDNRSLTPRSAMQFWKDKDASEMARRAGSDTRSGSATSTDTAAATAVSQDLQANVRAYREQQAKIYFENLAESAQRQHLKQSKMQMERHEDYQARMPPVDNTIFDQLAESITDPYLARSEQMKIEGLCWDANLSLIHI